MEKLKIFLLDLNPETDMGSKLRGILESSKNLKDIQLQHEFLKFDVTGISNSDFANTISCYNPDILFLIFSQIHLRQSIALFKSISSDWAELPIIVVLEKYNPDEIFTLLKYGTTDFVIPPLKEVDIVPRIQRLLGPIDKDEVLIKKLKGKIGLKQLVGESPVFKEVIKKISLVAKCDATVLLAGETGTGKELCARAIHYLGPRSGYPFVPVNCGAIPLELVENELFGHAKSAFTGASSSQPGLIKEAEEGTLFLDDIDCLPISAQAKLLRFLQEKDYRQLGSTKMSHSDVRVIAATNIDLEKAVEEGKLRQDLYYRLSIIPLTLPTLQDRQEDITLLAHHFLEKSAAEHEKKVTEFAPDAMQKLLLYEWPGNVRELEGVIERAVLFSEKPVIRGVDIDLQNRKDAVCRESFNEAKSKVIRQFEIKYIQTLLRVYQGNITKAAQEAQKDRRAFWQLIRKHHIDVQTFRPGY